ncbi:extracellular solute-binding protein [uncultured Ruminococcus sp.]|uniref:extracellular solute-binding protein n=1 Tax=uncultured Ruminococcus sp. TaxID=165186 RepID=UPI002618C050|nr:extracellular solute-binding protein [uncultured Ruminococcus sp.]
MEKINLRRITALSAALTIIAGAAASCSRSEQNGKNKDTAKLLAGSYHAMELDCDVENIRSIRMLNDNTVILSSYDYSDPIPTFYLTDGEFADFSKIDINFDIPEDQEVTFNVDIAPDGEIVALGTFADYGDMEKPDYEDPDFDYEKFDFEEFYSNVKYSYKLYVIDIDGTVKAENELSGLDKYIGDDNYGTGVGRLYAVGGGKSIVSVYGDSSDENVIVGSDGKIQGAIELDKAHYIEGISVIDDDTLAATGYFEDDTNIKLIDAATFKGNGTSIKLKDIGMNGQLGRIFKGDDKYAYYIGSSSGLFGINEEGEGTEIVNWLDSDLGNGYVDSLVFLENGDYVICYEDYEKDSAALYRLTKRDAADIENTKVITIGVLYDDWAVKNKVSKFNKSNEGVRIKMVDYSKYDNYSDDGEAISRGIDQLKKDVISGDAPDMIVSYNRGIIKSLQNKGLFVDLYDFLDKDSELSRDDIMPNVLSGCEIGGKLLSISPSFTVNTYFAKKKYVDKPDWSVDDMIDTYKNLPKGMRLTDIDCKENMLSLLMGSMDGFIDYDNGTCHFDDPDVKKLLQFCDQFPSEDELIDWDDEDSYMEYYADDNIMNDKVILANEYLCNFRDYTQEIKGRFKGEEVCFVGNPSSDGKGAVLSLNENFAILTNAEDKDLCWNFIKEFFKPSESTEDMNGFPSLKSEFDKMAEESMHKPKYKDENGKEIEDDLYFYSTDKPVKINPLTEEEKNVIVDYIKNADKVEADFDPEVQSILEEEMMAYLKGEKTSDEVIDLLQSRISILVSEQS